MASLLYSAYAASFYFSQVKDYLKITATAYHSHNVMFDSFHLVSKIWNGRTVTLFFFFFGIC